MDTISSSETFAKRRAIFLSVRKTELREPKIAIRWFGKY